MIQTIEEALEAINAGKIIAVRTDTVFGFIADGTNQNTISHLYEVKKRDLNKGYIVFVASIEQAKMYAKSIPSYAYKLMEAFWPGALTCIFPVKKSKSQAMYLPDGASIGIRIPNELHLLALLEKTDKTIISTSANISGEPTLTSLGQIAKAFGGEVVCWDFQSHTTTNNLASTIIDCQEKDTWRLLREGSIKKEAIWNILDE